MLSMRLLMEAACAPDNRGRYNQYIFLTPHDISSAVTLDANQKKFVKVRPIHTLRYVFY